VTVNVLELARRWRRRAAVHLAIPRADKERALLRAFALYW
jgi:hypothetical protein